MTEPDAGNGKTGASSSSAQSERGRRDKSGRAYAGSQRCLQIWVNRKQDALSRKILKALRMDETGAALEWVSPLEEKKFAEYRDGAFLAELGLGQHANALKQFWPKGGPVWDGLAKILLADRSPGGVALIEGKSYPAEVRGGGCKAKADSATRNTIETSLADTARWLGLDNTPKTWTKAYYQSANRIAHVRFLRETLRVDAYMVNVCFTGDPHKNYATSEEQWAKEKEKFRKALDLDKSTVAMPWLVDVVVEAPRSDEDLTAPI